MEKFKIVNSIELSGNKLYLLNQPFEKAVEDIDFKHGRLSSYHQKEQFKAEWFCYNSLVPGTIIFCESSSKYYTTNEALLFMSSNNGVGLTRDNLFMLPQLFIEKISPAINTTEIVLAIMGSQFLPKHLSYDDRRICPKLEIEKDETSSLKIDYDWWWIDQKIDQNHKFAFMKPSIRKHCF